MAETAISTVIDHLIPLLATEAKLLRGVHQEVAKIKDELESIQCFLKDADAKAEINDGVKIWVKQVRKVAYQIEDVVDLHIFNFAKRPHRHGFIGFFHDFTRCIIKPKWRHEVASQILDIKTAICEIKERADRYGFNFIEQGSSSNSKDNTWHDPRVASHFMEDDEVVGIESTRDELISWLVEGESRRAVISLVGMGGVGKTTLANNVYSNQKVTAHFACCAWIPVSQSYKAEDLLREMINQFHRARNDFATEGIDKMQEMSLIRMVREYLKVKRYVVVLDDVWKMDFWGFIRNALPNNNNGSRIIITTRIEDVASFCLESPQDRVYYVKHLTAEKAWELFCNKAFQYDSGGSCPPELEKYSFDIVRRCEGLPLAIVAIGGLLSTKTKVVSEWRIFCHSLGYELEMNPHLTSVAKIVFLSYHDLPYYLKSCFLYFCIIPEDYSITCLRLIWLWIAEGFVKEQEGKTLEDVAEEYLTELIHRRLVQVSTVDLDGKAITCRVHALVREIILLKCKELNFCKVFTEANSSLDEETRRLSIHTTLNGVPENISNSRIRSFFLFRVDQLPESSIGALLAKLKFLKVLDLEDAPLHYLPEEVGTLYHLKYLSARNTKIKTLPKSIGKLFNLQTLDLSESLVSELPIEINMLHKLRNLLGSSFNYEIDYSLDSVRGVKVQEGIGRLGELQVLYSVEAQHNWISLIKEMENLRQMRKLGIKNLTRENGKALCASIEKMTLLRSLSVCATREDEIMDLQSISSPPPGLQTLFLYGRLEKLPKWILKLQHLIRLVLQWPRFTDDPLKALQTLPNLLLLNLYEGYDGEQLYFEVGGFERLRKLRLQALNAVNSVIIEEGALPSLEELAIGPSRQLKEVPNGIHHLKKLNTLEFLDMPDDFRDRMQRNKGQDRWIVDHIKVVRFWVKDRGQRYKSYTLLR